MKTQIFKALFLVMSPVLLGFFFLVALLGRFLPKAYDVGLGPEPLINNLYHKRALEMQGYSAQTFALRAYYITSDFDLLLVERMQRVLPRRLATFAALIWCQILCLTRYRALYIYFNGGVLSRFPGGLYAWFDAPLLKLAGVKLLVMPYGSDVQDMSLSPNLNFKHAMTRAYPLHYRGQRGIAAQIHRWTQASDVVLAGVEWVDYMHHWHHLMLAHFSIDTEALNPEALNPEALQPAASEALYRPGCGRPLRLLHAPNHRGLKGSQQIIAAVETLRAEGLPLELELIERRPNAEVLAGIARADLVLDQMIIGWYAMFALEAMALGRPVACYLRPDLVDLYINAGLVERAELPFVDIQPQSIEAVLRAVLAGDIDLAERAAKARAYVVKHHSLSAVGRVFAEVNRSMGLLPSPAPQQDLQAV